LRVDVVIVEPVGTDWCGVGVRVDISGEAVCPGRGLARVGVPIGLGVVLYVVSGKSFPGPIVSSQVPVVEERSSSKVLEVGCNE
jgi:hypothetical protein